MTTTSLETFADSVELNGKQYWATVTRQDQVDYAELCASHGTRRCAIDQLHSSYVHVVIGLAEQAGTVDDATAELLMTENGYALCQSHAATWRRGGWSGRMYPAADVSDCAELAQLTCADCNPTR